MSFSSLEAGHGGASAGAADYPLRTLVRDRLRREVQRALDALLPDRDEGLPEPPDRGDDDYAGWLRTEESPLLLENVEEFVLDPEAHLRAIAERVEGSALRAPRLPGEEPVADARPGPRGEDGRDPAEELRARLRTLARLDAERIVAAPRRRGTPKGETRTHYLWLVSPDRDISNSDFKRFVLEIIRRRWPGAVVAGYIHRDTDNTHLHLWISAETLSGKKIDVTRATPSGDAVLDKYPDLDEDVARSVSRHFGDPSIYDDHIARKLEWVYWRERFEESLRRGKRPPVMPHRARHDYDWIGERRAVSERERDETRPPSGAREKAAPVPRSKSLMGALELWGKTVHLEARVNYRLALLDSLDAWRELIDYSADGVKQSLELKLEEAEREHGRYRAAFEKTLENRAVNGYPELKYPLHNTKQIAEMTEIARLTRDAELIRYVRSYTSLDRPGEEEALAREVGARWGDEIEARVEVIERAAMLERVASAGRSVAPAHQSVYASESLRPPLDKDHETVRGWLHGGWSTSQMRSSLGCFDDEGTRRHAERYVMAREYLGAVREALADSREGAERLAAAPALDASQVERINALLGRTGGGLEKHERTFFREVVTLVNDDRVPSKAVFERLVKQSAPERADSDKDTRERAGDTPPAVDVMRPHDERWMGRLILSAELKAVGALSLAACDGVKAQFEGAVDDARAARAMLDLARSVRRASGITEDPPAATPSAVERRAFDNQHLAISQQLRARDLDWTPDRIAAVEEFMDCLLPAERRKAESAAARERARLEELKGREQLEKVRTMLNGAGELYVRSAYRAEGFEALRDPARFDDRVSELAARYAQIITDSGVSPEKTGLDDKRLREAARLKLTAAVTKYEREELEIADLSRLEGRAMLAEHLSAASQLRREWFERHWPVVEWNYVTMDGRGRASLAGACEELAGQLARGREADGARLLVCEDEINHIVAATQPEIDRLREEEARLRAEWLELRAEHEGRLSSHREKGLRVDGPRFTEEEWGKLEACVAETRNVALNEIITGAEEQSPGLEYAARRATGRALAAEAIEHGEYKLAPKFDRPPAAGKLALLPAEMRPRLMAAFAAHAAARDAEKSAAFSYRAALEARAGELAGRFKTETGREARPLLSVWEAGLVASTYGTMDAHSRYRWEKKLARVEVEAPVTNRSTPKVGGRSSHPGLGEWKAKNMTATSRDPAMKFQRVMDGRNVMSQSEARMIVREQSREKSGPSRGGP